VQWRLEAHTLRLGVNVPPGVTAAVYVPGAAADRVTEGGRAASAAPGVRFVRQEALTSVFEVDSGAYDFTVKEFRR
jgi:alpha-L-rhamnosidase